MQFTILQLLGMARGVSSGMKYLSEMGFIHRVRIFNFGFVLIKLKNQFIWYIIYSICSLLFFIYQKVYVFIGTAFNT